MLMFYASCWHWIVRLTKIRARLSALRAHLIKQVKAQSLETPIFAYINTKISPFNIRYQTLSQALRLMQDRKLTTIIETGTSRCGDSNCAGDGCSSLIFTDYVRKHGGTFYSVDIDQQALLHAQAALEAPCKNAHFICSDSVDFLYDFSKPIDFLYLDSYDFDTANPLPSQQHHLREIQAAYSKLHKNSVVMIDDCMLPRGGKGKLAISFLKERGWRVLTKGYQVILIQD